MTVTIQVDRTVPQPADGKTSGTINQAKILAEIGGLWDRVPVPLTAVGGTTNAVTATASPALKAAPVSGQNYVITPTQNAAAGAITVTLDGTYVLSVLDQDGTAYPPQQWIAGRRLLMNYDGVALRVITFQTNTILPKGFFFGLLPSNNAGTPTTKIDISAGKCRSDDDTVDIILSASITKRIDTTWVAGSGNGGLDTGVRAASTFYGIYLIAMADGSGADAVLAAEGGSPSMPAGYTVKRQAGWLFTDGSSNILAGTWWTDGWFFYSVPILDINQLNVSVAGAAFTMASVPKSTLADCVIQGQGATSGAFQAFFNETAQANTAPSGTLFDLSVVGNAVYASTKRLRTDASRQIRMRPTPAASTTTCGSRRAAFGSTATLTVNRRIAAFTGGPVSG
jgi:hypothetical protein